ncbi:MAG TPA: hypothetical protein VGN39_05190 [Terriglobales bacterium]|nr:hypothetical protein [Terriglobales bacterium]
MPRKIIRAFEWSLLLMLAAGMGFAQTGSSDTAGGSAPVSYSSVTQLNDLLSNLQQASQATQLDLAKLRIEKWKTDGSTKRQTDADVQSIQRNLQSAMPEIVGQLKNSPENLPETFKLYRNLDALYDVFASVVESAGAFGSKDEFQFLQNDLNAMEKSRHVVADRMDALSTAKENELGHLRAELQNAQAAISAAPPKKVVVDDTEPEKKPVKKKVVHKTVKPATPPAPAPATTRPPQ